MVERKTSGIGRDKVGINPAEETIGLVEWAWHFKQHDDDAMLARLETLAKASRAGL